MATIYRCGGHRRGVCSYESPVKWRGACPIELGGCGRYYDIMVKGGDNEGPQANTFAAAMLAAKETRYLSTGDADFDRVIGGGFVPGSAVLLAGGPKLGKTTLSVKLAANMATHGRVMYCSGEQSSEDVGQFVKRVGIDPSTSNNVNLYGNESEIYKIMEKAENGKKPVLIVIDSLQTAVYEDVKADAGSISQMKAVINGLTEWAKQKKIALLLLCHVNKDGDAAGPKMAEHLVDTIAYWEPDYDFDDDGSPLPESENRRILSCGQNRNASGPGTFTAAFEMTSEGIKPFRKKSKLELV
jgi:DNA repair protein RadA/Sms